MDSQMPLVYLGGMIAAFAAAFALAYPAALTWKERGINVLSLVLYVAASPFVILCLICMDNLIGSIVPDRRRGFPVEPIDQPGDEKEKLS